MASNPAMTADEAWVFNGIDGATGGYLLPEMTPSQVSSLAQGGSLDLTAIDELKQRTFDLKNPHAGVEADARDLAETGWGVVFAHDADPALQEPSRRCSPCARNRLETASGYSLEPMVTARARARTSSSRGTAWDPDPPTRTKCLTTC